MKRTKTSILLTLIFLIPVFCEETEENRRAVDTFNHCTVSLQKLYVEIEALPDGALKEKETLKTYSTRMKGLLTEMHDAASGLPVSETTKVCLDYVLHKGCDLCSCNEACCTEKSEKEHQITGEDAEALLMQAEESMSSCPLPVRLALIHDLRQAGVRDNGTLEAVMMIPPGEKYRNLKTVNWEKEAPANTATMEEKP